MWKEKRLSKATQGGEISSDYMALDLFKASQKHINQPHYIRQLKFFQLDRERQICFQPK